MSSYEQYRFSREADLFWLQKRKLNSWNYLEPSSFSWNYIYRKFYDVMFQLLNVEFLNAHEFWNMNTSFILTMSVHFFKLFWFGPTKIKLSNGGQEIAYWCKILAIFVEIDYLYDLALLYRISYHGLEQVSCHFATKKLIHKVLPKVVVEEKLQAFGSGFWFYNVSQFQVCSAVIINEIVQLEFQTYRIHK